MTLIPIASSAAMIAPQAKASEMRAPVRMTGSEPGSITARAISARLAPSARAALTRLRSTSRTAWIVLTTKGKNAA